MGMAIWFRVNGDPNQSVFVFFIILNLIIGWAQWTQSNNLKSGHFNFPLPLDKPLSSSPHNSPHRMKAVNNFIEDR